MTSFPPLLVEFAAGSRLRREALVRSPIPILGNGPPGTFVVFSDGSEVPLPTDQITFTDDAGGCARVGFGGMRFDGVERGQLTFRRVRDLLPGEQLSPERGQVMTLHLAMVSSVLVDGQVVWGARAGLQ